MDCKINLMRNSTLILNLKARPLGGQAFNLWYTGDYFSWYITSFTILTVLATLGKAAATRLGA